MQVALLPPRVVDSLSHRLLPHLEKAADYTFGRYEAEDILTAAGRGEVHMWVVTEEGDIKGITVTRFWDYPRKRCLDMLFLGGDDGFSWKDPMLATLRRWAREAGCEVIESSGRPGFARAFKDDGYRMLWQVYELPVSEIGVSDG